MKLERRQLLVSFIGALAVSPFAVDARQPDTPLHRIGVLAQDLQPGLMEAFPTSFKSLAMWEGADIGIELRNAEGQNERLAVLANELIGLGVEVIVAVNTPAAQAAKKATKTVPIIIIAWPIP